MRHDDVLRYMDQVKAFILAHYEEYPTLVDPETIRNIAIHYSEGLVEEFRKEAFAVSGFCIKDEGGLDIFNKIAGKGTARLHDIYIDFETINQSCKFAEENYGVQFQLDEAIKCIITHELMHSISVGFADENSNKDEAHTDYLAKRIYEAFYPGKKYFTSYDYPMPPKLIKPYKEQVKLISLESLHCYLRGK